MNDFNLIKRCSNGFYAILLTACAKRDTFLEAVFLWNTPFEVALSIVAVAASNADLAASLSFAATAAFTFFTAVLTPDLIALFLSAFVLFTKILFFADLILAKMHTSYYNQIFKESVSLIRTRTF